MSSKSFAANLFGKKLGKKTGQRAQEQVPQNVGGALRSAGESTANFVLNASVLLALIFSLPMAAAAGAQGLGVWAIAAYLLKKIRF